MKDSLVLIGMPGCGKSTVGVLLAKTLCMGFVDTDLVIQERERRSLQRIISEEGLAGFIAREKAAILSLDIRHQVIATGGSVVLCPEAMEHLRNSGFVIFLDVPLPQLERRIRNIRTRGIVLEPGQTLQDVEKLRRSLYLKYADHVLAAGGLGPEQMVDKVAAAFPRAR